VSRIGVIAGLMALGFGAAGLVWANRPDTPLPPGTKADLLIVQKSTRQLSLSSSSFLRGGARPPIYRSTGSK
jgi:hypothetical protein